MTRFASACVASPHRLASEAGRSVLAAGGNALDAAVAANLALAVATPYHCGLGGDLSALVWDGAALHGYLGVGRAPAAASRDEVARATGGALPLFGPHTVTVPGAVRGWFDLLDRFGSRSFAELAAGARRLASDGVVLGALGAEYVARARQLYAGEQEWNRIFGGLRQGDRLRQPDLARALELLAAEGPEIFYGGPVGQAIAAEIQMRGGLLAVSDLAEHEGEWVAPLEAAFRGLRVAELPPPAQGVTALEALRIADGLDAADPAEWQHLLIEAAKVALADRDLIVTEPSWMPFPASRLLRDEHVRHRRAGIDRERARVPMPGARGDGGTAFVCAADGAGMMVSLIQSNWIGFGSGVVVPGWGIGLHNRGAFFSLDPGHPNVVAPRKRTLHTLIPAMLLDGEQPLIAFGTMGGDGQAQTHLQLLARLVDEQLSPQQAIDAPRWVLRVGDWSLIAEDRFPSEVLDGLRVRGHRLSVAGSYDSVMGHAHAIRREPDGGWLAGSDPRAEGGAAGL